MMAIIRSERNFLMMLFCVAFMLRLLIFFTVTRHNDNAWMLPDSKQYHIVADNIARGNGFVNVHGNPQMLRLPGYPIFLAGLYVLLHHDVYKTLLIQIFLSCFIPLCIFLLGLVLFPSQILIARIAGLIAALHIGFGIYAGMLTTETLFLIFFLVFLILFFTYCNPSCDQIYAFKKRMLKSDEGSLSRVSFRTHGTLLQFFLIGVLAGLTSLIRPVGVYIMFISLAIMFVSMPFKQWLKKAGTFGIAWLMTIAPWVIRNFLLTGAIFFHTLPGEHFLQYAAAHVMMDVDHCEYAHARSLLLQAWDEDIKHDEHMLQRPLNEYEQCLLAEQRAYAYMRHHPLSTIKTSLIEMVKTCVGLYVAQPLLTDALQWPDYTRSTTLWTKVKRFLMPSVRHKALIVFVYAELIQHVVLFFGILLFLLSLLWHAPWRKAFLLASGYIITFIVITLAYGCARLRMPIEPLLVIFAGAGWIWLYGRLYGVKKSI